MLTTRSSRRSKYRHPSNRLEWLSVLTIILGNFAPPNGWWRSRYLYLDTSNPFTDQMLNISLNQVPNHKLQQGYKKYVDPDLTITPISLIPREFIRIIATWLTANGEYHRIQCQVQSRGLYLLAHIYIKHTPLKVLPLNTNRQELENEPPSSSPRSHHHSVYPPNSEPPNTQAFHNLN